MPDIILDAPVRWWHCPTCDTRARTQQAGVHTQFHNCPALGDLGLPMIEVQSPDARAPGRQRPVEREDYIGDSNAGPISAVMTERRDGSNDCTVLAPTATSGTAALQPSIPGTPTGRKDVVVGAQVANAGVGTT